jgi:hypothetical protein
LKSRRTYRSSNHCRSHVRDSSFFQKKQNDPLFFQPVNQQEKMFASSLSPIPGMINSNPSESGFFHSGQGIPSTTTVFGGNQKTLTGETKGDYDGGTYKTKGLKHKPATNCPDCDEKQCVNITGTLVSTFKVKTTVNLPSISGLGKLSKCQKQRVEKAIKEEIAPHEQDHVRRFRKYNGTVETPITFNGCQSQWATTVDEMHKGIASERETTVQADSDSIDPFHVDVDMDCK